MSGGPLRTTTAASRVSLPPINVQRHQRGDPAVRTGATAPATVAALLRRERQPSFPGRLRPARRARILGAPLVSDAAATNKSAPRQAQGRYGMIGKTLNELDDRLGIAKGGRTFMDKIFPDHWSFMLGEIALYSFVILMVTGVFLTFYFIPSSALVTYHGSYLPLDGQKVTQAFSSTVNISFAVRGGLLMRQMHHWSCDIFVGAIVVTQVELLKLYLNYWDSSGDPDTNPNYGTISRRGLISVINDSRWSMSASPMAGGDFTTVLLNQKMRFGPVILGYYEPAVSGNHVVVAYGASETYVAVMNPDGARFIGLPVGHYSQSSEIILGIPTR